MCQTYWRRYWIAPSKRKESEINSQLLIQYNECQEDAILEFHGNLKNLPKLSLEEGNHAADDI